MEEGSQVRGSLHAGSSTSRRYGALRRRGCEFCEDQQVSALEQLCYSVESARMGEREATYTRILRC